MFLLNRAKEDVAKKQSENLPKSKVKSRQKAKRSGNCFKFNIKFSHDKIFPTNYR